MTPPPKAPYEKVLTIIAEPPDPRKINGLKKHLDIVKMEKTIKSVPTNAIDDLVKKIKPHERASSVTGIDLILEHKHPEDIEIVQIIGHAYPGKLSLGDYWTKKYHDQKYYYAIDSNPGSYSLLKRNLRRGQTLRLLGCALGANAPGFVSNGTTLLFALEQLLNPKGVTVLASTENVSSADFAVDGTFIGDQKLVGHAGSLSVFAKPRQPTASEKTERVAFSNATEASTTVNFVGLGPKEFTGTLQETKATHTPLTLPLYTTSVRTDSQTARCRADLIRLGDHYQLQLHLPEGSRYYTMDSQTEDKLVQLAQNREDGQPGLIPLKTALAASPFFRHEEINFSADFSLSRSSSDVGGFCLKRFSASTAAFNPPSEPV